MEHSRPRVVIVGGGFGGLNAALQLGKKGVSVTLLDKSNVHLFQPLLYQVATGFLNPGDIATPLRAAVSHLPSVQVLQSEMTDLNVECKEVVTPMGSIPYDVLVLATGVTHSYFGNVTWEDFAPGLKTIDDASRISSKVLSAFEAAEQIDDAAARARKLTFVIVGAGPSGVELAGALYELTHHTMKNEFRRIAPEDAAVILLEGGPRILPSFHAKTSAYVESTLRTLGVDVRTSAKVISVDADGVVVETMAGRTQILSETVLWAAGVRASSVSGILKKQLEVETDTIGRIKVENDLRIPGHPDMFVIGDLAWTASKAGTPLPGVAQVAIQQGHYVAQRICTGPRQPSDQAFSYFDKGNMAVIGKGRAVAETGALRLHGFIAWLAWAFVHIYFLIEFQNKLVVFLRWAWNFVTNKRGVRIISPDKNAVRGFD